MRTLVTNPLVPGALWATLAALCAAGILAYLLVRPPRVSAGRRVAVGALLALGAAGLLTVLLNPTWQEVNASRLGRPALGVLLDTSASMATAEGRGSTRLADAEALAGQFRDKLGDMFEVRLWTFDTQLRAVSFDEMAAARADGIATDLGGGVGKALRSGLGEEAALVVLSDGIHNVEDAPASVSGAARTARAMAVPVFTKTLGTDAAIEDLDLQIVTPDNLSFIGQKVPIRALLAHPGIQGDAQVTLSADGKPVGAQRVTFAGDEPAHVEFTVSRDAPGLCRYVMEAAPRPGEVVLANNSSACYLRVVDQPIRVLVLEGKPYWDFKFLMRRLAEDRGLRVTGAVRMREGRVLLRQASGLEGGPAADQKVTVLPGGEGLMASYEELKKYDVVVLGRDAETFLTPAAMENLVRWVAEWGGSVVCARGRPVQMVPDRLDALLPVRWQAAPEKRFRVHMTRDAEWAGWFPSRSGLMPSLSTGESVEGVKPLASVLARADLQGPLQGMAVVTSQRYGAGVVLVIEGSGLWRWAVAGQESEAPDADLYGNFWNSLLRWLAASADFPPGSTAGLRPGRQLFTTQERIALQLTVREDPEIKADSAPAVDIMDYAAGAATGAPRARLQAVPDAATAGLFNVTGDPLPAGAYLARLVRTGKGGPVACAFDVSEPRQERLDLRSRPGLMRMLAEESGGIVLTDDPAGQVRKSYIEHWREQHPDEFQKTPAWDRSVFLLSLACVMAATWLVRRRGGLV
jgi:hypothetical protein